MAYLCASDLDKSEFLELVKGIPFPDDSILMAFTPGRALFQFYNFDERLLEESDMGRVFNERGELKWSRFYSKLRVVYLGSEPPPEALVDCSHEMAGLAPSRRELLLWGKRTDLEEEWIEQQVPCRFTYPVKSRDFPRGRVALVVEDWLDSCDLTRFTDLPNPGGLVRFSRYHSLKEVEEK